MSRRSLDRRRFLKDTTAALAANGLGGAIWPRVVHARRRDGPPRVAAIITEYRGYSHADVIAGRFIQGYTLGSEPYWPRTKVVSMYVDQFPPSDLSRGMAAGHGIEIHPTIEAALTMGRGELAVDGVLIIGEHGNYPYNDKGQRLYPRRRFFEETVNTFQEVGATAPVFNDKHLSATWDDARWMYDMARRMRFPLMAGSSLPTTWRKPDLELPLDCELEGALAVGFSDLEAYGFHALETLQSMIERRRGGETGVRAVTCLEGAAVWEAAHDGRWSRTLLDAALDRIEKKTPGRPEQNCQNAAAFLIEHVDGLRSAVLMLSGHASEFAFAAQVRGERRAAASLFWLQEPVFGHFSYLVHNIESMFLTGQETYPPERTLLTTGVLDAVIQSRFEGHKRIETPWLATVAYRPSAHPVRRAKFADFGTPRDSSL